MTVGVDEFQDSGCLARDTRSAMSRRRTGILSVSDFSFDNRDRRDACPTLNTEISF
jgi:hypothetical protein